MAMHVIFVYSSFDQEIGKQAQIAAAGKTNLSVEEVETA